MDTAVNDEIVMNGQSATCWQVLTGRWLRVNPRLSSFGVFPCGVYVASHWMRWHMRKGTLATLDVPRPVPERTVPPPRILVVDDEPRIRDFVSRALTAAGYLVEVACD